MKKSYLRLHENQENAQFVEQHRNNDLKLLITDFYC